MFSTNKIMIASIVTLPNTITVTLHISQFDENMKVLFNPLVPELYFCRLLRYCLRLAPIVCHSLTRHSEENFSTIPSYLKHPIQATVFAMLSLCYGGLRKPLAKYSGPTDATVFTQSCEFQCW